MGLYKRSWLFPTPPPPICITFYPSLQDFRPTGLFFWVVFSKKKDACEDFYYVWLLRSFFSAVVLPPRLHFLKENWKREEHPRFALVVGMAVEM